MKLKKRNKKMVSGWFLVRKDVVSLENLADSCDADRQQTLEVVPVFTSHTSAHLSGWKKREVGINKCLTF